MSNALTPNNCWYRNSSSLSHTALQRHPVKGFFQRPAHQHLRNGWIERELVLTFFQTIWNDVVDRDGNRTDTFGTSSEPTQGVVLKPCTLGIEGTPGELLAAGLSHSRIASLVRKYIAVISKEELHVLLLCSMSWVYATMYE